MNQEFDARRDVIKDIIRQLHRGLSVEKARERFVREVGDITAAEIAQIEQSLIDEGMSPEEIRKFCNVHALLFEEALAEGISADQSAAHPVHLFALENQEISSRVAALKDSLQEAAEEPLDTVVEALRQKVSALKDVDIHYTRKEQILFPYLEQYGFMGPSKVMWGKDDEIRDLLRCALAGLEETGSREQLLELVEETLKPLTEEIEGMVFKEENILFPTAMEKLTADDWVEVLTESNQVGYAYIELPGETEDLLRQLREVQAAVVEEPQWTGDEIAFPTGSLNLKELDAVLRALPVEITFVDGADRVRYFSDHPNRIFVRTRSVIGREVRNCHPPGSVTLVEEILESFKQGARQRAEFWLEVAGRFIYIEFIALHDGDGNYIGALELTQDITDHRTREGERRLLDESG